MVLVNRKCFAGCLFLASTTYLLRNVLRVEFDWSAERELQNTVELETEWASRDTAELKASRSSGDTAEVEAFRASRDTEDLEASRASGDTVKLQAYRTLYSDYPARDSASLHTASCDTRTLWRQIRQNDGVTDPHSCQRVFYNRVPKCGSRGVLSVITELAHENDFTAVSLPMTKHYDLSETTQKEVADVFEKVHEPFFVAKHVHYIDFQKFGYISPVYINVIRDPIERASSHYYYKIYGSAEKNTSKSNIMGESFDECLWRSGTPCQYVQNIVVPFFCGHSPSCRSLNKSAVVARAKSIIQQRYLVVGLTEDLPVFMEVLETIMPHFFKNASVIYKKRKQTLKEKFKTNKRPPLTEASKLQLRHNMAEEYELYEFVKQRFYNQMREVRLFKNRGHLKNYMNP